MFIEEKFANLENTLLMSIFVEKILENVKTFEKSLESDWGSLVKTTQTRINLGTKFMLKRKFDLLEG